MTAQLSRSIPSPRHEPGHALRATEDRCYVGERGMAGCRVVVLDGGEELRLRSRTSDPLSSFSWGRSGASARELAWSILYDSSQDVRLAEDWCSDFCVDVVSRLPHDAFCIASRDVLAWLFGPERG
jgi:hypothetical protein